LITVIPAKAGIQRVYQNTPAQPDNWVLSDTRVFYFHWIPAFAGMTVG
jgi:hypothetical protein